MIERIHWNTLGQPAVLQPRRALAPGRTRRWPKIQIRHKLRPPPESIRKKTTSRLGAQSNSTKFIRERENRGARNPPYTPPCCACASQRRESPGIEHARVAVAIQKAPQNVPLSLGGKEDRRLACKAGRGSLLNDNLWRKTWGVAMIHLPQRSGGVGMEPPIPTRGSCRPPDARGSPRSGEGRAP
jgi:hypothetical protein